MTFTTRSFLHFGHHDIEVEVEVEFAARRVDNGYGNPDGRDWVHHDWQTEIEEYGPVTPLNLWRDVRRCCRGFSRKRLCKQVRRIRRKLERMDARVFGDEVLAFWCEVLAF